MSEWRSMRSAPKDGSAFLCHGTREDDDELVWAVCYLSTDHTLCLDCTGEILDWFRPTHWMELPE